MSRLLIVFIILAFILFLFWNKTKRNGFTQKSNLYKNLFIILIVGAILFFLATSGRFILPQIMQIFKNGLACQLILCYSTYIQIFKSIV